MESHSKVPGKQRNQIRFLRYLPSFSLDKEDISNTQLKAVLGHIFKHLVKSTPLRVVCSFLFVIFRNVVNPHPTNIFYNWIIPIGVHLDPITKYARKQTQCHFYDISLCLNVFYYSVNTQPGTLMYQNHLYTLFTIFPRNIHSIFFNHLQ